MSYLPPLFKRTLQSLRVLLRILWPTEERVALPPGTVVLVLDVIEPYSSLWTEWNAIHLRGMLSIARCNNHKIVFTRWARTRFYPNDALSRRSDAHWSCFIPESALDTDGKSAFIDAPLVQPEDQVVDAVYTNALAHGSLALPPKAPVLIAGMWTESCVINTARAAAEDDRDVYVYAPACAGHASTYALWTIEALYGRVVQKLTRRTDLTPRTA